MSTTEIGSRTSAIARQSSTRWVAYAAIAVGLAYTLFPVWWMVSNSLKTRLGAMAGYALARFHYPGSMKFHLSFWILSTRMIPPIVTIIPLFIFFTSWTW